MAHIITRDGDQSDAEIWEATPKPLDDYLRDFARLVAQHEMGHYVLARRLGFTTGDVTIELLDWRGGRRGGAAIELAKAITTPDDVAEYLRRRVIVLYGGGVAEALPRYGSPSKTVDVEIAADIIRNPGQGAEQDHAKAKELIHLLRNLVHPETPPLETDRIQSELAALDTQLFERTVELVEADAGVILGLARRLIDGVKEVKVAFVLSAEELGGLPAVQKLAGISVPVIQPDTQP